MADAKIVLPSRVTLLCVEGRRAVNVWQFMEIRFRLHFLEVALSERLLLVNGSRILFETMAKLQCSSFHLMYFNCTLFQGILTELRFTS